MLDTVLLFFFLILLVRKEKIGNNILEKIKLDKIILEKIKVKIYMFFIIFHNSGLSIHISNGLVPYGTISSVAWYIGKKRLNDIIEPIIKNNRQNINLLKIK